MRDWEKELENSPYMQTPNGEEVAQNTLNSLGTTNPYLGAAIETAINAGPALMGLTKSPENVGKESHSPEVINRLADEYIKSKNLNTESIPKADVPNVERGSRIAQAFEDMKHNPNNPEVKDAYNALINETKDQFKKMIGSGVRISRIEPGQENPYKSSKDLSEDISNNNHIHYYPTEQGFGTQNKITDNPLLQDTGIKDNDKPLLANDLFRIVHDYFGHASEGNTFGPKGEENAWRKHMPMFSPEAQKALTTETRGQNSWVNYGPLGEQNRANPSKTTYADQKVGILPDWIRKDVSGMSLPIANFLKKQEGSSPEKYLDIEGKPTIGFGANLNSPETPQLLESMGIPYQDVISGKRSLTPEESDLLLNKQLEEKKKYFNIIKKHDFPNAQIQPNEQTALQSLMYNNPHLIGPAMRDLLNKNQKEDVAKEILLRSNKDKQPGIQKRRMEEASQYSGDNFKDVVNNLSNEEKSQIVDILKSIKNPNERKKVMDQYPFLSEIMPSRPYNRVFGK